MFECMSLGPDFLQSNKVHIMNNVKLDITCHSGFRHDDDREIIIQKILSLKGKLIFLEGQLLDYNREQYHRRQECYCRSQMERKRIREDEALGQKKF